jgi:4-alpha-glucanotransferase
MKVLQFAFGADPEAPSYQPHNYQRNCVVYTGTHDNNTTLGWYKKEACAHPGEAEFALRYLLSDGRELHWDMIRAAIASVGNTVIIPMQDALGLGPEHRMNYPGSESGNWEWRMRPQALSPALARRLRTLSETYHRTE